MKTAYLTVSNQPITDPNICRLLLANQAPFELVFDGLHQRATVQFDPRVKESPFRIVTGTGGYTYEHIEPDQSGLAFIIRQARKIAGV